VPQGQQVHFTVQTKDVLHDFWVPAFRMKIDAVRGIGTLDEGLADADEAFIEESIVDPSAEIAEGFQDGIMPPSYGTTLSPAELDSLVKYLAEVTK
jgi:hypothetical protein